MRFTFTDKEIKEALKNLTIIADTREKGNKFTLKWFDDNKIPYKVKKIDHGDYTAYLPANSLKGITKDLYFDKDIVIEKKGSIDEICGNFSKSDKPRIKSEFAHLGMNGTRCFIFIEDNLYDKHLRNHNYRSQYDPKRLYQSIKGFEAEYNTVIRPISSEFIGAEIYYTLYYQVRNILKRNFDIIGIDF